MWSPSMAWDASARAEYCRWCRPWSGTGSPNPDRSTPAAWRRTRGSAPRSGARSRAWARWSACRSTSRRRRVGVVYVDRLSDNLHGAFKQSDLNLLAVLANSAAVAIVEAQRSLLLMENQELRKQLKPIPGLERVVSHSREMSDILSLLTKVGDSSATVLFMGETGTGKGLLAHVVHEISGRRDGPSSR